MRSLSLDASVNHVGWSYFNSKAKSRKAAWKWGTINPEGGSLEMRIMDTIEQLEQKVPLATLDYFISERPAFYSSEKGKIAAHMNYTIDLAAINYFIAGWLHMDHREHFAITAIAWKGNVAKAITQRQFFRHFPEVKPSSISEHAIDAIMLHRYWLTEYAPRQRRFVTDTPLEYLQALI